MDSQSLNHKEDEQINNNDMKNLLKKALDDAFIKLENQVPQTKKNR